MPAQKSQAPTKGARRRRARVGASVLSPKHYAGLCGVVGEGSAAEHFLRACRDGLARLRLGDISADDAMQDALARIFSGRMIEGMSVPSTVDELIDAVHELARRQAANAWRKKNDRGRNLRENWIDLEAALAPGAADRLPRFADAQLEVLRRLEAILLAEHEARRHGAIQVGATAAAPVADFTL